MRSTPKLCLVLVLAFASRAAAWEPPSPDAPRAARSASLLASYAHRGQPVRPPPVRDVRASQGSSDLVLHGILLLASGLVAGGAGFALMAACPNGSRCYSPTLNTVSWVLAAPGIIPVAVGLVMIFLGSPSHSSALVPDSDSRFALMLGPSLGGLAVGARARF